MGKRDKKMNDQEGVELSPKEFYTFISLIISKDRDGIQCLLDKHNVSSIQYLLWANESVIFHTTFDNIKWLNCPEDFDINIRNALGRTLLFNVWKINQTFDELLKRNINVNICDERGLSAVMFYAGLGCVYHTCKLLDYGASLKEAREAYKQYYPNSTSKILDTIKEYEQRETSCRKSVAGFTLMGLIHKDLIPVVAGLVWLTRRREEWFKEIKK